MRIALMGSRGIPACYSGFETFYEQLSIRLVERGHQVTVFNRSNYIEYKDPLYKNVQLVRIPTIPTKHLDTLFHTFLSVLYALFRKYDIVYFCGVGNAPLTWIPRILGARTFLNVDGADWKRDKWSRWASVYLRACESLAARLPNVVIADSRIIQEKYQKEHRTDTVFIPYGANIVREEDRTYVSSLGLQPSKYILFVGRLVPENGAHILIEAFKELKTSWNLVIVGGAPYTEKYQQNLRKIADERIIFTGGVFGKNYSSISCHAAFFVLPSRIDGTRPVLLDQMGFGNCVLVSDSPANLEVIGDAGLSFNGSHEDLVEKLEMLVTRQDMIKSYGERGRQRVKEHYCWDRITVQYEALFSEALRPSGA